MTRSWGEFLREGPTFDFTETSYYRDSMGDGIKKQLVAFESLIDPAEIVDAKLASNTWERDFRDENDYPEARPINIDPGYLTEAKLVLATTKDRDHRIYLDRGIFAEVTIYFHRGKWASRPWTYPDYERPEVQSFLSDCRQDLRDRYNRAANEIE